MADETYSETTNSIAGVVPCDPGTVRDYADLGLIDCRRLASGMRLFKPSTADRIRELRTERLARRGGNHGKKTATA